MRYKTREEIAATLRARYRAVTVVAIAAELGVSYTVIRQVLCGVRPPTKKMIEALGYDPVPVYRKRKRTKGT